MDQQGKGKICTGNQSMELEICTKSQDFNAVKLWLSDNLCIEFRHGGFEKSQVLKAVNENPLN